MPLVRQETCPTTTSPCCTRRRMGVTDDKRRRAQHQPTGRWIRPERRLAIYLRDEMRCLLCGLRFDDGRLDEITLDHVIPRSKAGTNVASNLYTCCVACNARRGDADLAPFVRQMIRHASKAERVMRRVWQQLALDLGPFLETARRITGGTNDPRRRRLIDRGRTA